MLAALPERLPWESGERGGLVALPGTPMYEDYHAAGRILDYAWSDYDFRHTVIRPACMTPRQIQAGADWLYHQFFRLDCILLRTLRAFWTFGPATAYLVWRLNRTYRYDNQREGIRGYNPAKASATSPKTPPQQGHDHPTRPRLSFRACRTGWSVSAGSAQASE